MREPPLPPPILYPSGVRLAPNFGRSPIALTPMVSGAHRRFMLTRGRILYRSSPRDRFFSVASGAGGGIYFFCRDSSAPRAFCYSGTRGSAQTRALVLMRRNPGIRRCVGEGENPAASGHIAYNPAGDVTAQRGNAALAIVLRYQTIYRRNTAKAVGYAGSRDSLYFRGSVGKAFLSIARISAQPPSDGRSFSPSLISMANITGPRAAPG